MERIAKLRGPVRAAFTRAYNELIRELAKDDSSFERVKTLLLKLERVSLELDDADKKILELLLEQDMATADSEGAGDVTGNGYEKEYEAVQEYKDKLDAARIKVQLFIEQQASAAEIADSHNYSSELGGHSASNGNSSKRRLKLPKIELKRFNGEIRDWLGFWSQFKRIHEDDGLEREDKFQYLIQATVVGSRARDIVESFPPTAENYDKVIESLKDRFGRDDLQIEYYVRELLSLVVQRVSDPKGKMVLAQLYDKLESHLRALESIGVKSEKYASMLFPLVESCLPEEILKIWMRSSAGGDRVDTGTNGDPRSGERLDQLLAFLRREVEGEERLSLAQAGFCVPEKEKGVKTRREHRQGLPTVCDLFSSQPAQDLTCIFCGKSHENKDCFKAQTMSWKRKKELLVRSKCCFRCLKSGHQSRQCRTSIRCVVCGKSHVALVCPDLPSNKETKEAEPKKVDASPELALSSHGCNHEVLLQTLLVRLESPKGSKIVRALFDSGAQRSYILKSTAAELGLVPVHTESRAHSLFGGIQSAKRVHQVFNVMVCNPQNDYATEITLRDQDEICKGVPTLKPGPWLNEVERLGARLTDIGPTDRKVEVLLGADVGTGLVTGEMIRLKSGLVAIRTLLGWVVTGKVPGTMSTSMSSANLVLLSTQASLERLWTLDAIGILDPSLALSKEDQDQAALNHFRQTVKINSEGRYEVELPWVEDQSSLRGYRTLVHSRCLSMTNKLCEQGRYEDYNAVINDWLRQGIIETVPPGDTTDTGYFLPHRAVFKEGSTTKVRPVFDASFHVKGSPSLNDCLATGPNLIEQIVPVLLRFRERSVGVVSDIEKAFLQISVKREDRNFLKFLWWEDFNARQVKELRHCRVVFGVSSSPFLLSAVLHHLFDNAPDELKACAEKLKGAFYVDNCVTSVDGIQDLMQFIIEAKNLLSIGKFNLRGWQHSSFAHCAERDTEPTTVLGVMWDKTQDVIFCDAHKSAPLEEITRRTVLSVANRLFDPLGICAPVTLIPKLMLQSSWQTGLGWDEPLPLELQSKFRRWEAELSLVDEARVPRSLTVSNDLLSAHGESKTLHTFCDASNVAYAAVAYLRIESITGVCVRFVLARSRVAPLKKLAMPRLELLACCIGARLASAVRRNVSLKEIPAYFWTDSTTALSWIQGQEKWSAFVMNRVKEIRSLTSGDVWQHVPGDCNPADLPSRGCNVRKLIETAWWEGPQWLSSPVEEWPRGSVAADRHEVDREREKGILALGVVEPDHWYARRFSRYRSIVRMIAWMLRFIANCRGRPEERSLGELSAMEIEKAENALMKVVQGEVFKGHADSRLKNLGVLKDHDGILRLKTRLTLREDSHDFKFPIVLPSEHPVVTMLILDQHQRTSHAGGTTLLSLLREKFWILRGRKTIRRVVSRCIPCKRQTAQAVQSEPAALPENRVKDAAVFEVVGIDLAGPLFLRGGKKAWIVLFTCAIYRAVHLELVMSLNTRDFLFSFRRFVARRGRPRIVYTDNGTNFVGAFNLFKTINWDEVKRDSSTWKIEWRFNPPTAAWWGGWWERLIQLAKRILRRVVGRASLSQDEMVTVLCECESIMNLRPITYVSESPRDPVPISPSMFLYELGSSEVSDLDQLDRDSLCKRLRRLNDVRQRLRGRFRSEYLGLLAQRPKENRTKEQLKEGDVVLVGNDNQKRLGWPLGVIHRLIPGKDGEVRVAEVKTSSGMMVRPVQRLFPLEISTSLEASTVQRFHEGPGMVTRSGRRLRLPEMI